MSHMVIHRSPDGQALYHQTESLEEAARHVEELRNAGQGADARIFRMHEVPIEVKTYYRVELPVEAGAFAPAEAPVAAPVEAEAPAVAAEPEARVAAEASAAQAVPEAVPAGANGGRFGLFGKG